MEVLTHEIVLPTLHTPVTLVPLGCVHADDEGFDEPFFRATIQRIAESPHTYVIGLGDYFSLARTTYRQYLRAYQSDEDSRRDLDNLFWRRMKEFYQEYLAPIRKKILGLAEGNHHWTNMAGQTDTQYLCSLIGCQYLGVASWHRLYLRHRKAGKDYTRLVKVYVHHGDWGGGGTLRGTARSASAKHAAKKNADLFLFAHNHDADAFLDPVEDVTVKGEGVLLLRPRLVVRAGTFTHGRVQGVCSYAERKDYDPLPVGYVEITLKLHADASPSRYRRYVLKYGKPPNGSLPGPPEFRWEWKHWTA